MQAQSAFGIAGLLGWPVAHSRSPVIHNHWLAQYGLSGRYVLFGVPSEALPAAVKGLSVLRLRGCNVTTPHKQAVMPLLDDVDPLAKSIGAVNTIVVGDDGSLRGYNNDGNGFVQSVRDAQPSWRPDSGPIAIIGAGGAARSVIASLAAEGAREIRVVNRTFERAKALQDAFGPPIAAVRWDDRERALDGVALAVNATNQGMDGQPALDVALTRLPAHAIVADLIYVPRETPFLRAARARGNATLNGLGMLLNQARPAFHAWFGVMPQITPELIRAVEATFPSS
ncbi:MAG TPA: shikimate dehydrogenase [Casimicrobiaceae bacterium]|nr:shikimate dehydrogenase [Casimicrobiaceae bacterium]